MVEINNMLGFGREYITSINNKQTCKGGDHKLLVVDWETSYDRLIDVMFLFENQ